MLPCCGPVRHLETAALTHSGGDPAGAFKANLRFLFLPSLECPQFEATVPGFSFLLWVVTASKPGCPQARADALTCGV